MMQEFNDARPSKNSTWPFQLDHVSSWAYWEDAFTQEECEKIIEIGNSKVLGKGTTWDTASSVRKSDVAWLYPSEDVDWAFRKMTDIVMMLNERFFKFNLFGALEGFQFTKYESPGGKYGMHIDSARDKLIRKLSFTLQLSSQSDYEGGDLCLYFGEEPEIMPKKQGTVVLFPSYVLHEVMPVTKGTRYSLVTWVTGEAFK